MILVLSVKKTVNVEKPEIETERDVSMSVYDNILNEIRCKHIVFNTHHPWKWDMVPSLQIEQ